MMMCFLRLSAVLVLLCDAAVDAQPLSRSQVVVLALERNPAIAVGHARWKAAEAEVLQTSSPHRPELELEYEGLPGVFDLGRYEERTFGITQRVEFPVRWWKRIQTARQEADSVRLAAFEAARRDVALAARTAYDVVLADDLRRALVERHVQLSHDLVKQARARFRAGAVGRLDVIRAEVAASRLENELVSARITSRRSQARLNTLLGNPPENALNLTDSLLCEPVSFDLETLTLRVMSQRPDLLAADSDLRAAQTARAAARASFFPDFSFGVARQTVAGEDTKSSFWRTGVSVELPLYAFWDTRGRIAKASAEQAMAEADREGVRLRVMEEVHAAFLRLHEAEERLRRMVDQIAPGAKDALDVARRSYDAGEATSLEYLSAQQDLVEVEKEFVSTKLDYRSAGAALMHAVGEDPLLAFDSVRPEASILDRKGE